MDSIPFLNPSSEYRQSRGLVGKKTVLFECYFLLLYTGGQQEAHTWPSGQDHWAECLLNGLQIATLPSISSSQVCHGCMFQGWEFRYCSFFCQEDGPRQFWTSREDERWCAEGQASAADLWAEGHRQAQDQLWSQGSSGGHQDLCRFFGSHWCSRHACLLSLLRCYLQAWVQGQALRCV